ncbi:MAG: YkgJ family cysteine cluster protein [Gammaproteobacteria bacterium]|nr:YkgJ family cysteine cluster protein [Gammaproteobacteria bacterium]
MLVSIEPTFINTISTEITCASCQASCCRLEVMLITETGVPEHFIATDEWGGRSMARLDDGWCAALNRNTLDCMIYAKRPLNCRVFEMGGHECLVERASP